MELAVRLLAPRSPFDFALRLAGLLALLNLINLAVVAAVDGVAAVDLGREVFLATTVGTPFVVLALLTMAHMKRLQDRLADLAATDVLTGLMNRRAFLARLDPGQGAVADGILMVLDVDHFKRVNDTWGHAAGDACLRALGARLREVSRLGDLTARLGGEEFGLFLPGAPPDRAADLGARIVTGMTVRDGSLTQPVDFTISIGAVLVLRGAAVDLALRHADAALYRAKAEGRARLIFAAPPPDAAGDLPAGRAA